MLPSPDNPHESPVWENYVVAQVVQAMLGIVPIHALAVGAEVEGESVCVRFQLSTLTEGGIADMEDIRDGLQDLLGDLVDVRVTHEVLPERKISPLDGIRWVYLARVEGPGEWERRE